MYRYLRCLLSSSPAGGPPPCRILSRPPALTHGLHDTDPSAGPRCALRRRRTLRAAARAQDPNHLLKQPLQQAARPAAHRRPLRSLVARRRPARRRRLGGPARRAVSPADYLQTQGPITLRTRGSHVAITPQSRRSHAAVTRQSRGSHAAVLLKPMTAHVRSAVSPSTARRDTDSKNDSE